MTKPVLYSYIDIAELTGLTVDELINLRLTIPRHDHGGGWRRDTIERWNQRRLAVPSPAEVAQATAEDPGEPVGMILKAVICPKCEKVFPLEPPVNVSDDVLADEEKSAALAEELLPVHGTCKVEPKAHEFEPAERENKFQPYKCVHCGVAKAKHP